MKLSLRYGSVYPKGLQTRRKRNMSNIIIDGYNLIGIFHKDMQKARNDLITMLINYKKYKDHDITVVFDGYKSGDKAETLSFTGGIRVIFSRLGERADDVIKRIISEEKKEWIVVSSDKDIASYAWSKNCIPLFSDTFLNRIMKQSKRSDSIEDYESEEIIASKDYEKDSNFFILRGNPHKLSKKQKAIKKALSKL